MTIEEQKSIIGGVVLDYAETKQRLAALSLSVQNLLSKVRKAEEALRFKSLGQYTDASEIEEHLENWPTAEQFRQVLRELDEAKAQKASLEQSMKEYGIQF